ncbi:MAG: hypothetical protein AAF614_26345 [Chloroflexota bacterium]
MAIQHTNYKNVTFTLYQKPTKKGNIKYYFSSKPSAGGTAVSAIPDGYEVYENPNGRVFLSKIKPRQITFEEQRIVESGMRQYGKAKRYKVHVRDRMISIMTPVENVDAILGYYEEEGVALSEERRKYLENMWRWETTMRFILQDEHKRIFTVQRYCYLGRIDDWIDIGFGELVDLVRQYVPHIDQESYFDLF